MEVRRTWNPGNIKPVIGEVWGYIADDSQLDTDFNGWEPRLDNDSRWYMSEEDGDTVGIFWMRRVNAITWEAHANIRPRYWGDKKGTEHCREAIKEMMRDTDAQKVIALIPDSSPQVQRMAEAIGFIHEGRQVASYLKNGNVYDQTHYGITRK